LRQALLSFGESPDRSFSTPARHQHRHDHRHLPDGLPHPKLANRESAAIQVKLDELIRVGVAQNSLVGIEHLTDDEIDKIRTECERRAAEKLGDRELQRADKKADDAAERVSS
jgi:hypothetical protein